jgi:two-component system chemotaxis response regulator CheY
MPERGLAERPERHLRAFPLERWGLADRRRVVYFNLPAITPNLPLCCKVEEDILAFSILIIDDSPVSRMMLVKCLPKGDYQLRQANGGAQGLEMYLKQKADLVLLDLTMPEMDGFETLSRLMKADPQAKVVVVSADIQSKAQERVLSLGALDFVPKPPTAEKMNFIFKSVGL